jgi:protein DGCR14
MPALRAALAAGADVNGTDPHYEQTAVIRAAMFGQAAAVRALLAAGADPRRKAAPDGQQALHWAAVSGNADAIRALLAAGVAADVPDGHEATPLDHALSAGQPESVSALLAGGADPAKLNRSLAFRIGPTLNPDTPPGELEALRRAIRSGRGLEHHRPDTGAGGSALTALAERANRPGAELVAADLVAAGARLDARDAKGRTARQIIEQWLPTQRDARFRAQMGRVLQVLRDAEARR